MSIAEHSLDEWRSHLQNPAATAEDLAAATTSPIAPAVTAALWGWLPTLMIVHAAGLLAVSLANRSVASGSSLSNLLFWLGLAVMLVPTAMRLISTDASRQERVGLLISLGMALYLVKLIQSPFTFTYSDEFIHLFNTNQILQKGTLFSENMVLPVSSLFPGLSSVTAAIVTLTGLSIFQAGAILIGAARLLLVIGLFLFAEQVSRSPRIAALATLIFMCNSNFLYWSAQFAYESLSFPLIIGVLYLIARRERSGRRSTYMAYTIMALLAVSAIVITHHLSSYFMVAFFFGWWALIRSEAHLHLGKALNIVNQWRKGALDSDELVKTLPSIDKHFTITTDREALATEDDERGPEGLTLISFILALAWLTYVAITTYGYLSVVLTKAGLSLIDVLTGSEGVRQLFAGTDGYVVPLAERVVTLAGVVLSLIGLPFGLLHFWQKFRHSAVAWILATGAVSYFAMLPLRLTQASWETGNRASVYFYLGLAFILALAADKLWSERQRFAHRMLGSGMAFALVFMMIFAGGVIAGWNPQIRFTQPLVVDANGALIEAQGVSAAKWMNKTLGANHRIVTDEANGRLMLAYGEQVGYVGRFPNVRDILRKPTFSPIQIGAMQQWELDYAVVDRREIAWDNMAGYFFNPVDDKGQTTAEWLDPAIYEKFDHQPLVSRVMDAGNLVIYDVANFVSTTRQLVNGEAVSPEIDNMLLNDSVLMPEMIVNLGEVNLEARKVAQP